MFKQLEKFFQWMEIHLTPVAEKVAQQRHLLAIRDGILVTMPLLVVGAFFLIIAYPPIASLDALVEPFRPQLSAVTTATFDLMTIFATFGIAYYLAKSYGLDAIGGGVMALTAFFVATPITDGNLATSLTGSKGLFVGMVLAIVAVEVQRWFVKRNITIKMPPGAPPAVARSFASLLPTLGIIVLVWALRLFFEQLFGIGIHDVIRVILDKPIRAIGGSLPGLALGILLAHLLWSLGIHGTSIVKGVLTPILLAAVNENAAAKMAGAPLPNTITGPIWEVFTTMGGSGTTLALTLLLFLFARSKQLKSLGRTAIVPAFFNINEPVVFGVPIVLNPFLVIPFLLTPLVMLTNSYVAMETGLVPKAFALVPWTTPIGLSGFLATGSFRAIVLQLFNLAVAMAIYYPFFRMWDQQKLQEEQQSEAD